MQHQLRPLCAALIRPDGASSVFVFQRCGGEHYTCSYSGPNLFQFFFTGTSRVNPPKHKNNRRVQKEPLRVEPRRSNREAASDLFLTGLSFHCFYFKSCRCCRCEYVEEFFKNLSSSRRDRLGSVNSIRRGRDTAMPVELQHQRRQREERNSILFVTRRATL